MEHQESKYLHVDPVLYIDAIYIQFQNDVDIVLN